MRKRSNELTPRDFDGRALVILDEVDPPGGVVGATASRDGRRRRLASCSFPATAGRRSWPARSGAGCCRRRSAASSIARPTPAARCRRSTTRIPMFELFNAPRSGDFSTAKFYRYRTLTPVTGASVVGAIRRRLTGARRAHRGKREGRSSGRRPSIRIWTNLPLQPVFLPFVHQLGKHAGRYADPRPWFIAGDVVDLSRHGELTAPFTADAPRTARANCVLRSAVGRARAADGDGPEPSRDTSRTGILRVGRTGHAGRQWPADCGQRRSGRVGSIASRPAGYRRGGDVGRWATSAGQ